MDYCKQLHSLTTIADTVNTFMQKQQKDCVFGPIRKHQLSLEYNFNTMENNPDSQNFKAYLPAFFILLLAGAIGLAAMLLFTLPTIGPRWLFFFFLTILVSAFFLPVTYFLNLRFPSHPPVQSAIIIRQAIWFGVLISALAWLQIARVLTLPLALILTGGLLLVELMLRLWEKSRWKPGDAGE